MKYLRMINRLYQFNLVCLPEINTQLIYVTRNPDIIDLKNNKIKLKINWILK